MGRKKRKLELPESKGDSKTRATIHDVPRGESAGRCDTDAETPDNEKVGEGKMAVDSDQDIEASDDEGGQDSPEPARRPFLPMKVAGAEAATFIVEIRRTISHNDQIELFDEPRNDCHIAFRRPSYAWLRVCISKIVPDDNHTARPSKVRGVVYVTRFAHTKGMFARLVPATGPQINCEKGDVARHLHVTHPRIEQCTPLTIVKALLALYDELVVGTECQKFQLVDLQSLPRRVEDKSIPYKVKQITNTNCEALRVELIAALRERPAFRVIQRHHRDFYFLFGLANDDRFIAVSLIERQSKRISAIECPAFGITYVFRGQVRDSEQRRVTRFLPGRNSTRFLTIVNGDLSYAHQTFYPELRIDGSTIQLADALCAFAREQCGRATRGFEVKSFSEWHPHAHWEDTMPIDMSEQIDKQLPANNRIEIRSVRYVISLTTVTRKQLLAAISSVLEKQMPIQPLHDLITQYADESHRQVREAREGSRHDIVFPLREDSVNAGKYLSVQLKAVNGDKHGPASWAPRVGFSDSIGHDGRGYPGQLMLFVALHRGLAWIRPGVEVLSSSSFGEANQTWRRAYVKRGTLASLLAAIIDRLSDKLYPELKAFTEEEIDKAPDETNAIEKRQTDHFKRWSGLIFDLIARYRFDAIINGRRVQFKTTEQETHGIFRMKRYRQDDFDALVFVSAHCCLVIPSSVLAERGLVDDERSIIKWIYVAFDERGCSHPDWLLPYAYRFDDEGRSRVRRFFGVE
jgi:hypothetical protein